MVKEDSPNEQHLQNSSGNLGEGGAVQCTLESPNFVWLGGASKIPVDSKVGKDIHKKPRCNEDQIIDSRAMIQCVKQS